MRQDTRLLSVRDFVEFTCLAADRGKLSPEGTSLRLPVHIIPASLSMRKEQPILHFVKSAALVFFRFL
jgi:hypothetical protein